MIALYFLQQLTNASLSSISSKDQDIRKMIHYLIINKSHEYDDISMILLKICGSLIVGPLSITLKNCLQDRSFPSNWENSNLCLFIRKVISNFCKTIGQFLCCQYGVNFSRELFQFNL